MAQTTTVNSPEYLAVCPYCGKVPTISHMTFQRKDKQWEDAWRVSCSNQDCVVQPQTKTFYAKDIAVRVWNTRAERNG